MTSTTAVLEPPRAARVTDRGPSLSRLTAIELRKMVDTRAGFWLQAATVLLTVALVVVVCLIGDPADKTLRQLVSAAVAPASIVLPIVGILLVSSEWSQRTAQITFTLVPRRPRVLAAKLFAGVALALVAFVIAFVCAAIGTAIASPDVDGTWSLPAGLLLQDVLSVVTSMVTGIGFGAVLLASAPAIVLYFILPIAWGAIGSIPWFVDVARWLDPSRTLADFTAELFSATEWARAGASLTLWMVLPVLVGLWRIVRSEVP